MPASAESRTCQNCKEDFAIEPDDAAFYEKISVPPPTFCPQCRQQRRFSWYTRNAFYKRPDDRTGEMIFSHYSESAPVKVYDHDYWWTDDWNPLDYGRDYDLNRPFFEQFQELLREVPLSSRSIINLVRSDYSNKANDLKDCYLIFNASYAERTMYSTSLFEVQDSMDISNSEKCQLCYEGFTLNSCFRAFWCSLCAESSDIWFSRDLKNCSNCFGCAGLRNKQYHIFNQPYSKEEYEKEIKKFNTASWKEVQEIKARARKIWDSTPIKFFHGNRTTASTGQYIFRTKNVRQSHEISESENCAYCFNLKNVKDCLDYSTWGEAMERIYECMECGFQSSDVKFCFDCWPGNSNIEYCVQCHSNQDLFGCVGLRKQQYCILNKKYSKEEYENMVARIKKQMQEMPYVDGAGKEYRYGEFFPSEISPHAYHETLAQEFFPLSKEEVPKKGFVWRDPERTEHKPTLKASELPDSIEDAREGILEEVILCAHEEQGAHPANCETRCTSAFKLVPQELEFYRKHNIPLPRLCYRCRYHERMQQRTPLKLWRRQCQCAGSASEKGGYQNTSEAHQVHGPKEHCPNEFETAYAEDRPEIVYCEDCYNAETV